MKYMSIALLLMLGGNHEQENIFNKYLNKIQDVKNFSVDFTYNKKNFDHSLYTIYNGNLIFIKDSLDTVFISNFLYTLTFDENYWSKYYNGKHLYFAKHNLKEITTYNPHNGERSPINGMIDGTIYEMNYIFNYIKMQKILFDKSENINVYDTLIDNIEYLVHKTILPDTEEFYNNSRSFYFNKKNNLLERVYAYSHYKDQIQIDEFIFKNINFSIPNNILQSKFDSLTKDHSTREYVKPQIEFLKIGDTVPNLDVKTINGDSVLLFEKEKIYLLDFWYTSCLPCLKMIPILNKLFDEFKDNIEIIGVNPLESDYKDKKKLNNFLLKHPIDYSIRFVPYENLRNYKINVFPTIYIIGKNREIIYAHYGSDENFYEETKKVLNNLIQKKSK